MTGSSSTGSGPIFSFDQKLEEDTPVGKRLLVGVACCDANGNVLSREQFHGIIESLDAKEGITIRLNNTNEKRTIPYDAKTFRVANLGNYTLTGTKEVVKDPDYTMKLTVYKTADKA